MQSWKDVFRTSKFPCLPFDIQNSTFVIPPSSNQSGDCPARSASSKPKAKLRSLPRQRDIRRALIEVDLVDTALRDSAFGKSETIPQVVSEAKDNMVALPGQLFYSTQIPVCLWFISRDKSGGKPSTRPADHPSPSGRRDGDEGNPGYADVAGFCKSATTAEIAAHGYVLTPDRYVGAEEVEDDGDPFEEKMPRLVAELNAQFAESAKLEAAIRANLKGLGCGI